MSPAERAVAGAAAVALPDGVAEMLAPYLGRQRWYAGHATESLAAKAVQILDIDELVVTGEGARRLWWALVESEGALYQLLIGERPNGEPAEFLHGHEDAVLGGTDRSYYYDGTLDSELMLALLELTTGGAEKAERVRPVAVEQSNTSLVYDDRIILKVFRRLPEGANPDVEVTEALARLGFSHVAPPVATWHRDRLDLALAQEFLAGGSEGWALAVTSLRDLYADEQGDPAQAGGDFAAEARRLGQMTAEMHLALAGAFGVDERQFRSVGWHRVVDAIESRVRNVVGSAWPGTPAELIERLRSVSDPGPAIRVHGDYHLSQVMRTDSGWYVLDFEGEPARPLAERMAPSSPLKDVTGMLRSFQYAAHYVVLDWEAHETTRVSQLGEAWERRNREAFLDGYRAHEGIDALLPGDPDDLEVVSLAFELDKALYELAYEHAYRPDWAEIPLVGISRMLPGTLSGSGDD